MVPLHVPWLLLCIPGCCATLTAASASVLGDAGEGGSFQAITRPRSGSLVSYWDSGKD